VGSPEIRTGSQETPAASSDLRSGSARSPDAPVTSSARLPIAAAAAGTSRTVPGPKMMRCAVANSNRCIAIPPPRPPRHPQLLHLRVPLVVVFRLLVLHGRFFILVHLDEHDLCWVILLLQKIEARYPSLLRTLARVDLRRHDELVEILRLHVSMNDENV